MASVRTAAPAGKPSGQALRTSLTTTHLAHAQDDRENRPGRRGRPAVAGQARVVRVTLRLTPTEAEACLSAATSAGLPLGEWIREAITGYLSG